MQGDLFPPPEPPWATLSDEQLLGWRISDLKVSLNSPPIQQRVERLYRELEAKHLLFRPACYLTTEWLTPDRIPHVGIPFYLAHPRLIRLEKTMMLEAEGESEEECMKLLRHETGHAINYAYQLFRKSRWRELFGPMTTEYDPHSYIMRPYSKQFVTHLRDNYAQAHPDEDFAETFAVWLTPNLDWRKRYADWGALKKLEYVDHLMADLAGKPPTVTEGPRYWAASRTRSTLGSYFKAKQREFGEGFKGFYDPALNTLFPSPPAGSPTEPAHRFLSRHRKSFVNIICEWGLIPKYSVHQLVSRLVERAKAMNLRVPTEADPTLLLRVGVSLNSLLLGEQGRYKPPAPETKPS